MTTTTSKPPHVPDGYHSVTPWMIGRDTAGLIDFLVRVFAAVETARVVDENGQIGHAEVRIGDSVVMMFDKPDWPPTPAFLRLYVADAAAAHDRVVAAGGRSVTKPTHLFWGDIVCRVSDPFGNLYWIHQRIEEVTEDEVIRRMSDPVFVKNLEYVQSSLFRPGVD
jgi:PhnB protein